MTGYRVPLRDMRFALETTGAFERLGALAPYADLEADVVAAVLEESARWSEEVLAPLNAVGDREGARLIDGQVRLPPQIKAAYAQLVEGGWTGLTAPAQYGGQGLPRVVGTAVSEMWKSANLSFSLCPMLTQGAVEALVQHGSETLRRLFLPKLVRGEWTGTMNLTEPQAGSDLGAIQSCARRDGDHYLLTGRKIFITWGDHDLAENIVHMVLARTPGAPQGVKGISLFVVPKRHVLPDGALGAPNDVTTVSIEHKLGIHGSPTCVLSYGDDGGAVAYLVGEEHKGLSYMFTMMNRARLAVGVEGLGVAERAYQQALAYARTRVQGRPPGQEQTTTIVHHPDVRRMLMTMKAYVEAMRMLAYLAALNLDVAQHAEEGEARNAARRGALLTPIVKGWCTEVGQELASLGLQVHGGVGYVEETGAAQLLRDARITTIYEGTTAIQANDLVRRKLIADSGAALEDLLNEVEAFVAAEPIRNLPPTVNIALGRGVRSARRAARFILTRHQAEPGLAGAVAVNFLMLLGTVLGGWCSAQAAVEAQRRLAHPGAQERPFLEAKLGTARFYAEHLMPRTRGLLACVLAGSESIMGLAESQL